MCFEVTNYGLNPMTGKQEYKILFDPMEAASINFDALDSAVVNAPIKTLADLFQTWERLAFRYQQQTKESPTNEPK